MSCTTDCILWGVSVVNFSLSVVLGFMLLCSTCLNHWLFALLGVLFKWFSKPTWVPPLRRLIPSTLWFIRLGTMYGICALLLPPTGPVHVLFYVIAVPFCVSLLYWTNRVFFEMFYVVVQEAKLAEKTSNLTPMSSSPEDAPVSNQTSSLEQMLALLR
jgi:hypothetical protein